MNSKKIETIVNDLMNAIKQAEKYIKENKCATVHGIHSTEAADQFQKIANYVKELDNKCKNLLN
jgi:uncharacterized protein YqgV (UPF0045/DUF77 family)